MHKQNLTSFLGMSSMAVCIGLGLSLQSVPAYGATLVENADIVAASNHIDPTPFYKADTDHDGIIDEFDTNPDVWNVTDRDLRFAQELAYRTDEELRKIFSGDQKTVDWFNTEKLNGACDVREFSDHWDYVSQIEASDGFSMSIFAKDDQVIAAFRGTQFSDSGDVKADAQLALGFEPHQVKQLPRVTEALRPYNKIYLTGHSLGGYLAMFFGGTQVFDDPRFLHGAVFNAPGIHKSFMSTSGLLKKAEANALVLTNTSYTFSPDTRVENNEQKMQGYGIHGDTVGGLYQYPNTRWTNSALSKKLSAHSSGQFFADPGSADFRTWFSTGYRLDKPYLSVDTDKDGITDAQELAMGTSYTTLDSDGDGFGDGIEVAVGSQPTDANNKPALASLYLVAPFGRLTVDKPADVVDGAIRDHMGVAKKLGEYKFKGQYPEVDLSGVRFEILNLPETFDKVATYDLQIQPHFSDGSKGAPVVLPLTINEGVKYQELESERNKAKAQIDELEYLTENDTTSFKSKIDDAQTKEAIAKQVEAARELNEKRREEALNPKSFEVSFEFVSDASDTALPEEFAGLVPEISNVQEHTAYELPQPTKTVVEDAQGTWTFTGWSYKGSPITEVQDIHEAMRVVGTWSYQKKAPVQFKIDFEFTSQDGSQVLPQEVVQLLPVAAQANEGSEVVLPDPAQITIEVSGGTWNFVGWQLAGASVQKIDSLTKDVVVTGVWTFEAAKPSAYEVNYQFVTAGTDEVLPEVVSNLLPQKVNVAAGESLELPLPNKQSVKVEGGTWSFAGWSYNAAEINKIEAISQNMTVVGVWSYQKDAPKTHQVSFEFASQDPNQTLPEELLKLLPERRMVEDAKSTTLPELAQQSLKLGSGTWNFLNWQIGGSEVSSIQNVVADTVVQGIWKFSPSSDSADDHATQTPSGIDASTQTGSVSVSDTETQTDSVETADADTQTDATASDATTQTDVAVSDGATQADTVDTSDAGIQTDVSGNASTAEAGVQTEIATSDAGVQTEGSTVDLASQTDFVDTTDVGVQTDSIHNSAPSSDRTSSSDQVPATGDVLASVALPAGLGAIIVAIGLWFKFGRKDK